MRGKLNYLSSVVLGLNDALIELTGILAGLTFAFQNTLIISVAGLITGFAASLSMGASEYLSIKSEWIKKKKNKSPKKAAIYTGVAYLITVLFLISPYLILKNPYISLVITILIAVMIIFVFNLYISKVKKVSFKSRFLEMLGISLGIAALTFVVGYLIRILFGIEI